MKKNSFNLFPSKEWSRRILAIGKNNKNGNPVFIWILNDDVGNNYQQMIACFISWGIHVPFIIRHQKDEIHIVSVGKVVLCHGSCCQVQGSLHDLSKKKQYTKYKKVINAAEHYIDELQQKKARAYQCLHPPIYGGWPNRYRIG